MIHEAGRLTAGLGILLLSVATVLGRPAQVILLRHAEKPPEETNIHLSPRGEERAKALATYFTNTPALASNGPPVALFAVRPTPHGHGVRTSETLTPFAIQSKMAIQTPYLSGDYALLAKDLLTRKEYDGKTVIVCWVHTYIPGLAKELGVKSPPETWKGDAFDRVWLIRFTKKKAKLTELRQHLLPGDSKKPDGVPPASVP